ncbi:MAG: TSUP family transporter [Planctomycetota bacterium]
MAALVLLVALPVWAGAAAPDRAAPGETARITPLLFCFLLFVGCIFIGVFAVLGGVGGGVVFTPLFMGFTSIDSYIVRSTGLFVAMAGTLVAARPFLRKGIANIKLLLVGAVPYAVFAIVGALLAGYIAQTMGDAGEAFIRGALGILVIGIGALFIFFGGRTEYPEVKEVDGLTAWMGLPVPYWEDSLNKVVRYRLTRVVPALLLFRGVGLISGLFGLGAGWAMVPVFNLTMLAPLKVAATCSTVMISLGDTAAVWPYILGGGMFPSSPSPA